MKKIDLHVHTTASDGTCTPEGVVRLASEQGLAAIAITDHDTVSGYAEAAQAGKNLGVEIVPGIEISTKFKGAVHILGYYIDPDAPELKSVLDWVVEDRDSRNRKMAELMAADGIPVSYEMMRQRFGEVIGRPHFARMLIELGYAADMRDAFDRYVEKGRRYYMPRSILSIERSIEVIVKAGGIPVLAHPYQYRLEEPELRGLIEHCMGSGLMGMECRYSGYDSVQSARLERLAEEYGLIKTGGSDFHGANKPHIALGNGTGGLSVPYEFLGELKAKLNETRRLSCEQDQ